MGLLAMGTSCFALVWVMGRSRVPFPPARMSALMMDHVLRPRRRHLVTAITDSIKLVMVAAPTNTAPKMRLRLRFT